uniref:Uncharacterized protein n=1 Tax=Oncorhynchus tshawytscha TaxID=74940 RepID=A0AAZ3PEL3_ONCTS
ELGSGTRQHVVNFAMATPFITWQRPSSPDIKEESRDSEDRAAACAPAEPWEKWAGLPRGACDVIVAINLLQYSSFDTVTKWSLDHTWGRQLSLPPQPYTINGTITPSCMQDLDQELRQMNPGWGLPDIDVLRQLAFGNGMRMERMLSLFNQSAGVYV